MPWWTPTVPPRCTSEQSNSGDVEGCLLSSNPGEPDERGWPSPPFPGENGGGFPGTGWHFTGSSYNGSPALAWWESLFVTNKTQVGTVHPNQVSAMPDSLPLFMGFLTEIQARGYYVRNGSGAYSFRCTASTRKDCRGLTRDSLSNHAFGLALDMNTTQNPMQNNYGINGASACQTPIKTDIPQWVVQVAEKWGLYWGGYGWSSGCSSPEQFKTVASRDPMHFEFNGSLEQAQAILCHNMGYTAKFEVINDDGDVEKRCFGPNVPPAGTRMVIHTNAPSGATAALVNLTATDAIASGYFTAESCTTDPPADRLWSNGNIRPGRAVASTAIVPLDATGRFCLFNSTAMHSIVDVQGFFAPSGSAPNGSLYTPITPTRTVDTRQTPFCTPEGTCTALGPIAAHTEIESLADAPVDAVATLANVTVVQPNASGYVTVDGCTALQPGPQTHSNGNFNAGDIVANLTLSPSQETSDGEQFCSYSTSGMHELIDVQGFSAPAAQGGFGYNALTASRVLDTRQCWTDVLSLEQRCGERNTDGEIIEFFVPPLARGNRGHQHHHRRFPHQPAGVRQRRSVLGLHHRGANVLERERHLGRPGFTNAAIVPVDTNGTYSAYVSHPMHVIIDLMGTFSSTGGLRLFAMNPLRVHDFAHLADQLLTSSVADQRDAELGATTFYAACEHRPTVRLDDVLDDRQSEPGAGLAALHRSVEPIEDVRQIARRDAWPAIADCDLAVFDQHVDRSGSAELGGVVDQVQHRPVDG